MKLPITILNVTGIISVLLFTNICVGQVKPIDTARSDTTGRQLGEVNIKSSRKLVRQEIDRLAYDVQNDPESKTLNAAEIMRKVPMLSLDAEGNISLRGSSSYRILINGKESGMMSANPKEVLKNMPASTIKRIEVITIPSSKYDAEGPTGLINIILQRSSSEGYNANIRVSHEMPAGGPGTGGNLTWSSGKFAIAINGSAVTGGSPQTSEVLQRFSFGNNPSVLINRATKRNSTFSLFGGVELSYAPDTLNLFTAEFSPYSGYNKVGNYRDFEISDAENNDSRYALGAESKYDWRGKTIGINLQHSFVGTPGRLFTLSYRLVTNDNPQVNTVAVTGHQNVDIAPFFQRSSTGLKEHIVQADLILPFKKLIAEAGLKMVLRYNASMLALSTYDAGMEAYQNDEEVTGSFSNQSKVYGAYNSYHYQFGTFAVKAGYRLEYSTIAGQFRNKANLPLRNYLNLIPAISLMQNLGAQSKLVFGYTNRIERPRIYQLDPFPDRTIPNFLSYGNPELKPALSHQMELNFRIGANITFNSNLSYLFANQAIQQVSRYDAESAVTLSTYENTRSERQLKFYIDLSGAMTAKTKVSLNGLISRVWFQGYVAEQLLKASGYNSRIGLNATQQLSGSWNFSSSLNFAGRETMLQQKTNAQIYTSFRFYGDVLARRLSASFSVHNPFIKFRYHTRTVTGLNFEEQYRGQSYARAFSLNLNWQLGSLSGGIKKNQRRISVDDGKP